MPLLQYKCPSCGKEFEELVRKFDDAVVCPSCGTAAVRSYSGEIFSATGKPAKNAADTAKPAPAAANKIPPLQLTSATRAIVVKIRQLK